jgi:hypothetical protein
MFSGSFITRFEFVSNFGFRAWNFSAYLPARVAFRAAPDLLLSSIVLPFTRPWY